MFNQSRRGIPGIGKWNENWSSSLQKKIEDHWLGKIEEHEFEEGNDKEKFYVLAMFPYPSGNLHMGHIRVYSISDTFARYKRMKGKNVIHPMGWDAFGLPAENAAMERGFDPEEWTQSNIEHMKSVLERMNFNFDWEREFATCDSDYYKWTQFLFLKMYESGLVYRKEAMVNWDPIDKTVLADEQVSEEGRSWRSGAIVEKRLLMQWFVRTSRYYQSLHEGLNDPVLEDWSKVVNMQKEWIGDLNGTTFDFEIIGDGSPVKDSFMTVWMSKPELVHRVKYIAVTPESAWNSGLVVSGVLPYRVRNPLSGDVIPVFVTNFLPFPDGRDNYAGIPDDFECDDLYAHSVNLSYTPSGRIIAKEEELKEFRREVCAEARKMGVGGYPVGSRARDWLISRQRYWGTPIPIVHCEACGPQAVPEEELPVRLPEVKNIRKGKNVLAETEDWVKTKCPKCGDHALRETDTMDTFVDSSWYYLRYLDPDNVNAPFGVDKAKKYMPVDLYIGGKEHATLHLYYARFLNHFLQSADLLPHREPFKRLLLQGVVRGKTYRLKTTGNCIPPGDVSFVDGAPVHKETGEELTLSWEKMSKSLFNGVEPVTLLDKYGSDSTKLTILTDVAPMNERDWSEDSFKGILNWQNRVWNLLRRFRDVRSRGGGPPDDNILKDVEEKYFDSRNYAVDMVGHSLEVTLNINLAIRKMQSLTNDLMKVSDEGILHSKQFERALAALIILMAPVAPCYASELWSGFVTAEGRLTESEEIRWDMSVFKQCWPVVDKGYASKFSTSKETLKGKYDREKKKKKKLMEEEKRNEEGNEAVATEQKS